LNADLAIADKRRTAPNVAEVMHIIGNVKGKNAIIVDDIVDTAGTICKTINALKKNGAKRIFTACTHGIFSGKAFENIARSAGEAMVVTDTIPQFPPESGSGPKIEVLSVAKLFADAIESIYKETSVSKLFL